MSRYPGTQFMVIDNSKTTATVPVSTTSASTPTYLSCFRSVKGSEKITTSKGNEFYDRYGTQDYVKFSKYGQPLFQASMNINNGATILGKRVVLDDATLANATLGICVTKSLNEYGIYKSNGTSEWYNFNTPYDDNSVVSEEKYVLTPVVFSVDNSDIITRLDSLETYETKVIYDKYKEYLIDAIENNTTNSKFLNKLNSDELTKMPYPMSSSYINKTSLTQDFSTTDFKVNYSTVYSNYSIEDVTRIKAVDNNLKVVIDCQSIDDNSSLVIRMNLTDCISSLSNLNKDNKDTTIDIKNSKGEIVSHKITVTQIGIYYGLRKDNIFEDIFSKSTDYAPITDSVIKNAIAKLNASIKEAGDTSVKDCFIFPLFTIFDNGRGDSIKNIDIQFDYNTSKTVKKAIYSLNVYEHKTNTKLESFSFSLNPYETNSNTGYTFDIESAVNHNSSQISVKTYYDSYDHLSEFLQNVLNSTSETIASDYDILFGHKLNGNYPVYDSVTVNNLLKRKTNLYNYAELNVFDNNALVVNGAYDAENTTDKNSVSKVKYYFYNYSRSKAGLTEKLEFGSDGYCLATTDEVENTGKTVDFYTLDEYNDSDIIAVTGQSAGKTFIDPCKIPVVDNNFIKVSVTMYKAKKWTAIVDSTNTSKLKWEADSEDHYVSQYGFRSDLFAKDGIEDSSTPSNDPKYEGQEIYSKRYKDSSNSELDSEVMNIYIPYSEEMLYDEQYKRFFDGTFDRDIFNLDVYFPNAIFDANYSPEVKLAIQRLAAYRGDFMAYMDMGIGNVYSYEDCKAMIPAEGSGRDLAVNSTAENKYYYTRDMHVAVTCLWYSIRNPYDNKVIKVTATYGLSNLYISFFANKPGGVFAGVSNGITIDGIIEGSVNYIPKIYPTSNMTSLDNIGGVYPSEDETIINEKQSMCDLKVNYGCYYGDKFSIETEYTLNDTESEFSYWNNVALVCLMMQDIRKACPAARYQFVTSSDLQVYETAINTAMNPWRSKFASLKFRYVQDDTAIQNKIFYAAIEVSFKPFAQAEIFTLTALNYSTLNANITSA